ncbi:COP9 signalosome complex subunit 3 [Exophiala dermatitidis]
MDRVVEESAALDSALLSQDPEQYDKLAAGLSSKLKKITLDDLSLTPDILNTLSPATHTIVYLHALLVTLETSPAGGKIPARQLPPTALPDGPLWQNIVQALLEFDPVQVRYCGGLLTRLVDYVSWGAEQTSNYVPAIQLLHHVILRLDSTSSTLTSTHRSFIRLCLLAQAYSEAIDILDRPIYHVPTAAQVDQRTYKYLCVDGAPTWKYLNPTTGLTYPITNRMYLEYYLLGGMCYLAMRRYKEAQFFFDTVISAPVFQNIASAIMVEAYKKWILVGLLLNGSVPSMPKNASPTAIKHVRAVSKPYQCVADAFKSGSVQKLRAEIEVGTNIWQDEGNYGLIVEVYQAFRKFSVSRLGRIFGALPIAEVAKRTSPDPTNVDETRAYLQDLVEKGDVQATILQSKQGVQILRFLSSSRTSSSTITRTQTEAEVEKDLKDHTEHLQSLLGYVQDTEHRMEVSREYIDYLKKLKKIRDDDKKNANGNGNGGGTSKGVGRGAANDDIDEDMMEEY